MASAAAAMPSSVVATLRTNSAKDPGGGAFFSLRSTLMDDSAADKLGLFAGGSAVDGLNAIPFRFRVGRFCAVVGFVGAAVVEQVVDDAAVIVRVGGVGALLAAPTPGVLLPNLTRFVALEAAALGAPGGGGGLAFGFIREASFFCLSRISRSLAVNLLFVDDILASETLFEPNSLC